MKSLGPWFPFFIDDFQGGTMHMSAAEIGSYVLLLCEQWRSGFVPTNGTCLARISRQRQTRLAVVLGKFESCGDGMIRNARMHAIREERMAYIREQARKGRLSAASRGSTVVEPEGQPNANPPSPLPSPSQNRAAKRPPLPPAIAEGFERFWLAYPRKIGKGAAIKAWKRATLPDLESILLAVERQMRSEQWTKDGGQFIPHPSTWINQMRWLDEAPEPHGDAETRRREHRNAHGFSISKAIAEDQNATLHGSPESQRKEIP